MAEGYQTLTEKEKETLRLIVRGHGAKSMARQLDLSVHTINERLRAARRKLSVTSSREAARLVLDREGPTPESVGDKDLGAARATQSGDPSRRSIGRHGDGRHPGRVFAWLIGGAVLMSLLVAFLFLAAPASQTAQTGPADAQPATVAANHAAVEEAARAWLALTDAGEWRASYAATGTQFRALNTLAAWEGASLQARVPLGAVIARETLSVENVPAPPGGYQMIRFRTDFANRTGVVEALTLAREDGSLKVVGYIID